MDLPQDTLTCCICVTYVMLERGGPFCIATKRYLCYLLDLKQILRDFKNNLLLFEITPYAVP